MKTQDIPFVDMHRHPPVNEHDGVLCVYGFEPEDTIPGNVLFSIGRHPWHIDNIFDIEKLASSAKHENCVAVGECGLDKLAEADFECQKKIFLEQISISEELKKPLIIHAVRSGNEIIQIRKKLSPRMPWVIHGFRGRESRAHEWLENGFILSFGTYIINEKELYSTYFHGLPSDRIFLETDESDTLISDLYSTVAEFKSIEREKLKMIIHENFRRVFRI